MGRTHAALMGCLWLLVMGCEPPVEAGCDGAEFVVAQGDQSVVVPVGVRRFDRFGLNVEIWYPAEPGSAEGKPPMRYDLRQYLEPQERLKISDEQNPWQECNCYEGLAMDTKRGPYPVVIFIHGTAGYAAQSAQLTAYWASQGFVVIAMDHPGIYLTDLLALNMAPRQAEDARELLAELRAFQGGFADLKGAVDLNRIAVSGHSAGGYALSELGDEAGVQMLIPMAAGGTTASDAYSLVMGALDDQVVVYGQAEDGYADTPGDKMLLGLSNAGHLAFSDLCAIGRERGGLIAVLDETGVTLPEAAGDLVLELGTDGCAETQMTPERGWEIINAVSGSLLRAKLQCRGAAMTADQIVAEFGADVVASEP